MVDRCLKPGCGALRIVGHPCTDWDCPQQYVSHSDYATLEAENARLLAEVERLTKALAESDRQSEKLEALLDPHVSWDDADLTPTKENADAG